MLIAVADTHAVIWYVFNDRRLSRDARHAFDMAVAQGDNVGFSSITLAEIVYLTERQRVPPDTLTGLTAALDLPNSVLVEVPFERRIAEAMVRVDRSEVPDLPDRIIVATALHLGVPLVTRDGKIQASGIATIW